MAQSMKDIRRQMKSVESTAHITNAMQLVSAAKFRRAKARYDKVQSHLGRISGLLEEMLGGMIAGTPGEMAGERIREMPGGAGLLPAKYMRKGVRTAYILITSSRGLCGGFNSGLLKALRQDMAAMESAGAAIKDLSVFGVGSRGIEHFERLGYPILGSFLTPPERMTFDDARGIVASVLMQLDRGTIDRVVLVYAAYINSLRQEPRVRQIFPLTGSAPAAGGSAAGERAPTASGSAAGASDQGTKAPAAGERTPVASGSAAGRSAAASQQRDSADWNLELLPSNQAVVDYMIPKYFEMTLYGAVMESAVCEHAARRAAMENASGNAGEMLAGLSLTYNRARQQAITDELIEIVSGSEAL